MAFAVVLVAAAPVLAPEPGREFECGGGWFQFNPLAIDDIGVCTSPAVGCRQVHVPPLASLIQPAFDLQQLVVLCHFHSVPGLYGPFRLSDWRRTSRSAKCEVACRKDDLGSNRARTHRDLATDG